MADYIDRQAALDLDPPPKHLRQYQTIVTVDLDDVYEDGWYDFQTQLLQLPPADVRPVPPGGIGEMSDGYHTFNGLYYQRKVLFASLVNAYKENAWKSYRHEDGELCFGGGWFIVGVETPKGNYTYHYENKDFDLFDCKELPVAPHWDGHTEGDVTRLLSLPEVRPVRRGRWKIRAYGIDGEDVYCSACECGSNKPYWPFCPMCGSDMRGGDAE